MNVILGNKSSEHLEESTLQIIVLGTPTISVFFTGKYQGGQDRAFQFFGGLTNNKHTVIYPGSGPSSEVIALHSAE
jgi:hypothetical protein